MYVFLENRGLFLFVGKLKVFFFFGLFYVEKDKNIILFECYVISFFLVVIMWFKVFGEME